MSETPKEESKNTPSFSDHESKVRVFRYMAILFAAAFLLLLLAFLMQNRTNQEAISDLTKSVSSVHNVVEENEKLREELDALTDLYLKEVGARQESVSNNISLQSDLDLTKQRLNALQILNNIRALYNDGNYRDARNLIAQNEPLLEKHLEEYSQNCLSEEGREIYDPLEAYRTLKDWLN